MSKMLRNNQHPSINPWICRHCHGDVVEQERMPSLMSHAHGIKLNNINRAQQQSAWRPYCFQACSSPSSTSPLSSAAAAINSSNLSLFPKIISIWGSWGSCQFNSQEQNNCIQLKIEWQNSKTQWTALISKYWIKGIVFPDLGLLEWTPSWFVVYFNSRCPNLYVG